MTRNKSRGNTRSAKYESYRLEAIDYVTNRDAKIDEMVADIRRKYPRLPETEARRIVTEHWAALERVNDVRNTVRSLDLGYDERRMIDRLNGRLQGRLASKLPDRLPSRLPDTLKTATGGPGSDELAKAIEVAAREISAATAASTDDVRDHLRRVTR